MRSVNNRNNNNAWHAKEGEATARDVEQFAARYMRSSGGTAWCVVVAEGLGWVKARHVRDVMAMTRADGALVVWVSDGTSAQVVWRKPDAPVIGMLDDDDLVLLRHAASGQYLLCTYSDDVASISGGNAIGTTLRWVMDEDDASRLTRRDARTVSRAIIALTDDRAIEIEELS